LRYEWLSGLATRKQKMERLFFERKFKKIASSYIFDNKYSKNKSETEDSTNGSTGQREKAPAEPVCLITFTLFGFTPSSKNGL
jgi:hypothetical protein